jgi:hypothetical protein
MDWVFVLYLKYWFVPLKVICHDAGSVLVTMTTLPVAASRNPALVPTPYTMRSKPRLAPDDAVRNKEVSL